MATQATVSSATTPSRVNNEGYVPAKVDVYSGFDLLPTVGIGGAVILGLLAVTAYAIRDRARTG